MIKKASMVQMQSEIMFTASRIYTPLDIALLLKVKERTVRGWLKEGRLIGFKVGRLWRIRDRELTRFLQFLQSQP